jgi:hypothetical protein
VVSSYIVALTTASRQKYESKKKSIFNQ